jgi:hypothetical protein
MNLFIENYTRSITVSYPSLVRVSARCHLDDAYLLVCGLGRK